MVDRVYRALLVIPLCQKHHADSENRRTTKYLLMQQIEKGFAEDYVRGALTEIASSFVAGGYEFSWDAMVG